jgi:hypothetical protein
MAVPLIRLPLGKRGKDDPALCPVRSNVTPLPCFTCGRAPRRGETLVPFEECGESGIHGIAGSCSCGAVDGRVSDSLRGAAEGTCVCPRRAGIEAEFESLLCAKGWNAAVDIFRRKNLWQMVVNTSDDRREKQRRTNPSSTFARRSGGPVTVTTRVDRQGLIWHKSRSCACYVFGSMGNRGPWSLP